MPYTPAFTIEERAQRTADTIKHAVYIVERFDRYYGRTERVIVGKPIFSDNIIASFVPVKLN